MLEVKKLSAKVIGAEDNILNNLSLKINDGEIHVIMGPNGTGKSTLSKVIMGHYNYEVTSGDVLIDGESINNLEVDERAKKGIFLCMQDPTVIEGVSNSEFIRTALNEKSDTNVNLYTFIKEMDEEMEKLALDPSMLHRSLNSGFSGGEKKKNEVLQLKSLKPKYIILDEIDSGLDVDSLKVVCDNICEYLNENKDASVLIITHYPRILEYIKPDFVHVLSNGKIIKTGDMSLALDIEKNGYSIVNGDYNE
ncbi:MAG: Fe-S cluster assembly ATPase SufC [Firmicutes bacterium]|nr:Fe-S cluster assembly ATPase SufC [Bacillota bacterium]